MIQNDAGVDDPDLNSEDERKRMLALLQLLRTCDPSARVVCENLLCLEMRRALWLDEAVRYYAAFHDTYKLGNTH